jgi:hypothetical protein
LPPQIQELLSATTPERDLEWLKTSLQAAIELEFFTLPPYLTAMWSIKNPDDPVALAIRTVVYEEMEHMATACNLLSAVGGWPQIKTEQAIPKYPGPMPGGVKPELTVKLQGLSRAALADFMAIEEPERPLEFETVSFPRIGAFYAAIAEAFSRLKPTISTARQLMGPLSESLIEDVPGALEAIDKICVQGEGTSTSPFDVNPNDLAHYYLFGEVFYGNKLVHNNGKWRFEGAPVPFPDCWPVDDAIPSGGYQVGAVSPAIAAALREFDDAFTSLVENLHSAWNGGGIAALNESIGYMFALQSLAQPLMTTTKPGTFKTYGPCFRFNKPLA